ncbi:MAG: transglycosylase SLT domain-containing protein [Vicinamibacterales bacterium]
MPATSVLVLCFAVAAVCAWSPSRQSPPASGFELKSSARSPVPSDKSLLWLVPADGEALPDTATSRFAQGVRLYLDGKLEEALPLVSAAALQSTVLADYASYYEGLVLIGLERIAEARRLFAAIRARSPEGYLAEAAALREAEAADASGDVAHAISIYEELTAARTAQPDDVWLRLAKAAETAGDRQRAAQAWMRLLYEFPLTEPAAVAEKQLPLYEDLRSVGDLRSRLERELARAGHLFQAGRYSDARVVFAAVRPLLSSAHDAALAGLRIAQCDYHLRRYRTARDESRRYPATGPLHAEALYYHLSAVRRLGDVAGYKKLARQLVDRYPSSPWAERTLNDLASNLIVGDDDAEADAVFREMLEKFPRGRYAERAAWKAGWWSYMQGRFGEAVRVFEEAAASFPRSDYRPAYLYWSARAYEKAGDTAAAAARYELTEHDYMNTYYGRLATERLKREAIAAARRPAGDGDEVPAQQVQAPPRPPTAPLIQALLAVGLYEVALDELLHAERQWGSTALTQATIAWVYNRTGELRPGINLMKRAYPQYMAKAGDLPEDILKVIFPLAYWEEIRHHAAAHSLDPYLVAALVAQESTFQADIRSSANAYGLMQIIPSTGRRLARQQGIQRFTTSMLTRADINLRLGTYYFASLLKQFGKPHLALAAYNAGDHRVRGWLAERPPLEQDEFIDDIPFPETQNYVKRILGTAEDYRKLYGARGT